MKIFDHCPQCQQLAAPHAVENNRFKCPHCGFEYYHNVAGAVMVLIKHESKHLWVKRNKLPKAGFWDLPGGFVNYNESAEQAAVREIKEELGLDIPLSGLRYIASNPNTYEYKGVLYHTLDLAFEIEIMDPLTMVLELEEVSDYKWIPLSEMPLEQIAFESIKKLLQFKLGLT